MKCLGLLGRREVFRPSADQERIVQNDGFGAAGNMPVELYLAFPARLVVFSVIEIGIQKLKTAVRKHRNDANVMLFVRKDADVAFVFPLLGCSGVSKSVG